MPDRQVTVTLDREEAEALQRRERLNDEDQNWGEAEERGIAKLRTALQEDEGEVPVSKEALDWAAANMPRESEEGEGEECDWIPCGGTGLKTWAATGNTVPTFLCPGCPDCSQPSGEEGEGEAKLTKVGTLSLSYSDDAVGSDCTCCDGAHCHAAGIRFAEDTILSMVTEFVWPLRHRGLEGRPVEVTLRLLPAHPHDQEAPQVSSGELRASYGEIDAEMAAEVSSGDGEGGNEYVVSYTGGPLDETAGFTDSLDPIRRDDAPGFEYRFEEFGTDGDAQFTWRPTRSSEEVKHDA
jgi:hypothetical protein